MNWTIEHLDEIDSTNSYLTLAARNGAPSGTVVYADFQSAGRGRLDRKWTAAPGEALLTSILLRVDLDLEDLQLAVVAVALSARRAIAILTGTEIGLKWPNDLVIGDKKLSGILAEFVPAPQGPAVVIGIGVNLTSHPDTGTSTSVKEVTRSVLTPRGLLDTLLEEISPRVDQLTTSAGRGELRSEYRSALDTLGQRVKVTTHDGDLFGIATDVDELGRIIVDTNEGLMTFSSADVVHLRKDAE